MYFWLPDSLPACRRLMHSLTVQMTSQGTFYSALGCAVGNLREAPFEVSGGWNVLRVFSLCPPCLRGD